MGIRFAAAAILLSALCLFSAPIYEATTWKGQVPEAVRPRSSLLALDRSVSDTLDGLAWYHAVRVNANRMLRVDLSSGSFDPILALYRLAGDTLELLAQDDDGGDGNDSRIERCLDAPGTYLLRVTAFGSSRQSGPYQIRASAAEADCAELLRAEAERQREAELLRQREEDSRRQEALTLFRQGRSVTLGQVVSGGLSTVSTRTSDGKPFEAWEFACRTGQLIRMEVEGHGFDAFARIYDAEGREVASNDDGAGNLNARIDYTCPSDATHYLVATSFSTSASGRYTMRVMGN